MNSALANAQSVLQGVDGTTRPAAKHSFHYARPNARPPKRHQAPVLAGLPPQMPLVEDTGRVDTQTAVAAPDPASAKTTSRQRMPRRTRRPNATMSLPMDP